MCIPRNKSKMYMSNIVSDFLCWNLSIFKLGRVVVSFIDVIWKVPFAHWVRVNTGGAARGCPTLTSCVGSFRVI